MSLSKFLNHYFGTFYDFFFFFYMTAAKHLSQRMQTKKWITTDQNFLLMLQIGPVAFWSAS